MHRCLSRGLLLIAAWLVACPLPAAEAPRFDVPGQADAMASLNEFFALHQPHAFSDCTLWDAWLPGATLWTGDIDFLKSSIGRMRQAIDYSLAEFAAAEQAHVFVPWVGHNGRSGLLPDRKGGTTQRFVFGVGNNYWNLLPFDGHDALATIYLADALRWMARLQTRGTLQGGGPPGGLGLDRAFMESVLVPQIMLDGFLGFEPTADGWTLSPQLPSDWPSLTVRGIHIHGEVLDITAHADGRVEVGTRAAP